MNFSAVHTAVIAFFFLVPLQICGIFTMKLLFIYFFHRPSAKRKFKDQKFGFGGKKSGKKWNTKESYNDVSGFRAKIAHGKGGKKGKGGKQNVSLSHTWLSIDCFIQMSK